MRFHRRLARRYGTRTFPNCDHRARCRRRFLARGGRAPRLDRRKSGSGKSTFLFNLAIADIVSGEGVAVIDPHGDLAEDVLDAIPRPASMRSATLTPARPTTPSASIPRPRSRPRGRHLPPPASSPRSSNSGLTAGDHASNNSSITALPRLSPASTRRSSISRASTRTIASAIASSAA